MILEVGLSGMVSFLTADVIKTTKDKSKVGLNFVVQGEDFEILFIIKYLNQDLILKIQKVFHLEFNSLYYIGPILLTMRTMRLGNSKSKSK